MALLFALCVVLGFAFHFLSSLPVRGPMATVAWACWLFASLLWAVGEVSGV